ncbi:hypothetical protein [Pseudidiomarina salinarum]|nr:hypothetical protein [Pseudidiomarina salinarum]
MIELDDKVGSLNVLANILDSFYGDTHLPDHCYIELKSEIDVSIQVRDDALAENGLDWIKEVDEDISKKLLTAVALFQYLEEKRLAYFVGELDLSSLGEVWADIHYTRCEFLDADLKPLIFRYSKKKIFVSETLRILEKNDFKTGEELRHQEEVSSMKRQLNLTRAALGFTLIGLLVSILVPIFVTSSVEIKNDGVSQVLGAIEAEFERINDIEESSNERLDDLESAVLSLQESIAGGDASTSKAHDEEVLPTADGGG